MKIKKILLCIVVAILIVISIAIFFQFKTSATETGDTYCSDVQKNLCEMYGNEYAISPQLLEAMIETESSGHMWAKNLANNDCYYGILQISSNTWGWSYDTEAKQIEKCCQMLTSYAYDIPDIAYMLDCYNGNSQAEYNYENGIISEYAKKVLDRSYEIEEAQHLHDYEWN